MPRDGEGPTETSDVGSFFSWVDELVTPSMLRLGYHRLGGFENDQPSSRGLLVSVAERPSKIGQFPPGLFFWLAFGFEAGSDAVCQLVDPVQPDNADELWLAYEPATGTLELGSWEPLAAGRVDWDLWGDSGPCSPAEVRRRLSRLGGAVDEFIASGPVEAP